MTAERPLFIDPVELSPDHVHDGPVPWWFAIVALALLATAVYYVFTFWNGPRSSSPHNFVDGRTAYEEVAPTPTP